MEYIELNLPKEPDKSFVVFKEIGKFFPCPWHYHPEYELATIVNSTGRRMVGDNIGVFEEGELVLLGSSLPHLWINDTKFINGKGNALAEAIVIHFKEDFLGDRLFKIPEMESFNNFLKMSNRGIVIKGEAKTKINAIMKKMPDLNGLQRLSSLFSIFNILSGTVEYELLASPGYAKNITLNSSDRLNGVIDYIMKNFDQDITLTKAASNANMGLTSFCNFFKGNYRLTFVEYLNSVRVGHACKLLSEKDRNIVEVAYGSGYSSIANFNKQFKKYKQMTPTEYRRVLCND
ncbi:MAG: AraC family transcriptional regulator [Chitinophagaceae bacterium]